MVALPDNQSPADPRRVEENQAVQIALDTAEVSLLRVAAQHRLIGSALTRGRWDLPEITLSWFDRTAGVSRNIWALLLGPKPVNGNNEVLLDLNAWMDVSVSDGRRARLWRNEAMKVAISADASQGTEQLDEATEMAFRTVASWSQADLSQHATLLP